MSEQKAPGNSGAISPPEMTSDELLKRLKSALGKDGDFPASAKLVSELRALTQDPNATANQMTELILKEPSLGPRVLHLVNSTFYNRGKPIMTVSQAVVRLGMKAIGELCAGLVLLQKFVPASRRGGSFANCLRKMVLTSLLSSSVSADQDGQDLKSKNGETGYLAGSFAELGTLLLAFYFPEIYEKAVQRAEQKKVELAKSIFEITGLTPTRLSIEVVEALGLPGFYCDVLKAAEAPVDISAAGKNAANFGGEVQTLARSVHAASSISTAISFGKDKADVERTLQLVARQSGLDIGALSEQVGKLGESFKAHCSLLEVNLPALPQYVSTFIKSEQKSGAAAAPTKDPFQQYVDEIRAAVDAHEPTASVITTVMETMAWSLGFGRVLLLLVAPSRSSLVGRMILGEVAGIDPKRISRPVSGSAAAQAPDAQAFNRACPIFNGEPVLENGWPFVAMPIGFGSRAIGVIYADKVDAKAELSDREKAAIGVLAELLDKSLDNK